MPNSAHPPHRPSKVATSVNAGLMITGAAGAGFYANTFLTLATKSKSWTTYLQGGALSLLAFSLTVMLGLLLHMQCSAQKAAKQCSKKTIKWFGAITPLTVGSMMLTSALADVFSPKKETVHETHMQQLMALTNSTANPTPASDYAPIIFMLNFVSPVCFIMAGILKVIANCISDNPHHPLAQIANFFMIAGASMISAIDYLNNVSHNSEQPWKGVFAGVGLCAGPLKELLFSSSTAKTCRWLAATKPPAGDNITIGDHDAFNPKADYEEFSELCQYDKLSYALVPADRPCFGFFPT